jgi:type II secretory pathway pseudopilin PulG
MAFYLLYKKNQKKTGFSLLEINLVLLLLALAMSLSYNFFLPLYQKKQVQLNAEKVVSQINFLRSQAIIEQTRYKAWFEDNIFHIEKAEPSGSYQIIYNEKYNYRINGSGNIYFHPNGRVSFLSIFVSGDAGVTRIVIASTGRVRLENL